MDELLDHLTDTNQLDNEGISWKIIGSLSVLEQQLQRPIFIRLLGDTNETIRGNILTCYVKLHLYPDSAIPYILEILDDDLEQNRAHAAIALRDQRTRKYRNNEEIVSALIRRLQTEKKPSVISQLFYALAEYADNNDSVVPTIVDYLDHPDTAFQSQAVMQFRSKVRGKKAKPAIPKLLKLYIGIDESVSRVAEAALVENGNGREALSPMLDLISASDPALKNRVLFTIGLIASYSNSEFDMSEAVPVMIENLKDSDDEIRLQSVRTLINIWHAGTNIDTAAPDLKKLLDDSDTRVQQAAWQLWGLSKFTR